jgi:hypothetical protein
MSNLFFSLWLGNDKAVSIFLLLRDDAVGSLGTLPIFQGAFNWQRPMATTSCGLKAANAACIELLPVIEQAAGKHMFCLDGLVFRSPESVRGWAGWSWLLVKKENEKPSPRGTRPDREEGERRLKVGLREG